MTILSGVILLRIILRLIRSLLKFSFFITHLAYLFEIFLPDFMLNVLPDDDSVKKPTDNDSVTINDFNKKIDTILKTGLEASKSMGDVIATGTTLVLGGAAVAKVVQAASTPQTKTLVGCFGLGAVCIAAKAIPAIKALKGSSDKGEGGSNFSNFIMNVVQSDSSLVEQSLAYIPLTILMLKLLVIVLSTELFKKRLFSWISRLKYIPKKITHFVLKSLERLQSISSVYIAVIISIMWLNLFNLTVFLRCLQVFIAKTENYEIINTLLFYDLILSMFYILLTVLLIAKLFGNYILTWLSKLWVLFETQIVHMLGWSNTQKSTQARVSFLEESNKARQDHLAIDKDTPSSQLYIAILLISLWIVSLFLDYTYKQVLHYL